MEFDEALDQGEAEADARRDALAARAVLELLEYPGLVFLIDADAGIGDLQEHVAILPPGRKGNRSVRRRVADGIAEQVEERLFQASAVGDHLADIVGAVEGEHDPLVAAALPGEVKDAGHHVVDVHRLQIEREPSRLDHRQVQDIVDQAEELARGFEDAVGVFHLARLQLAEIFVGEDLGEADDRGQRRAQRVGYAGDELRFQPVGGLQGLVAFAQGALDLDGVGNVEITEQHGAIGKGHAGVIEYGAVGAFEPPGPGRMIGGPRDDLFLERLPVIPRIEQVLGHLDELGDPRFGLEHLGLEPPHTLVSRVVQLEPAVPAEYGDGLEKVVQGLLLHGDQGVVGALQRHPVGDVFIGVKQPAQGMGIDDHPQDPLVGQVQKLLQRLDQRGEQVQPGLFIGPEVGLFGQPAMNAKLLEDFALGRLGAQPLLVQTP